MLPKVEILAKLKRNALLRKEDFMRLDNFYYYQAADIKALLDCPVYKAHTNETFKLLGVFFLHRVYNLRVLLHGCAEMNCFKYDMEQVWKPRGDMTDHAWEVVKALSESTQNCLEPLFEIDAETRVCIRQMVGDIQLLMREFRIICVYYHKMVPETINQIIQTATIERDGPHPLDCSNDLCEYKK